VGLTPVAALEDATFAALVTGPGTRSTAERLVSLRRDRTAMHLRKLAPHLSPEALDLFLAAYKHNREAVRVLLTDPLIPVWTSRLYHGLRGTPGSPRPTPADLDHLWGVALAAALVAGIDGEGRVPVRDGLAFLPGIGGVRTDEKNTVRLKVRRGEVRMADALADLVAVRHVCLPSKSGTISAAVNDLDPYRDGYHVPAAPGLTAADFRRWERVIHDGWSLLWAVAPGYAEASSVLLHTMVPLQRADDGTDTSATLHDSFGAFGLTEPRSAADFAVTVVHELHHSRFNAIRSLHPMWIAGADAEARFFAPWRTDARPISGLMHGAYAFLAVADFWRAMMDAGESVPVAQRRFAEARCQSAVVVRTIQSSGLLTPDGMLLVAALARWSGALDEVHVPPGVMDQAQKDLRLIHERWVRLHRGVAGVRF
jgi:uncharacterized protein